MCRCLGIPEVSVCCVTQDNTKKPLLQIQAFRSACVTFAGKIARCGAALLLLGDKTSGQFPPEFRMLRTPQGSGMKVNPLLNYGWKWNLSGLREASLRSQDVPRRDLIMLSGGPRSRIRPWVNKVSAPHLAQFKSSQSSSECLEVIALRRDNPRSTSILAFRYCVSLVIQSEAGTVPWSSKVEAVGGPYTIIRNREPEPPGQFGQLSRTSPLICPDRCI